MPGSTTGVPSIPPSPPDEERLYLNLLTKVDYDIEQAEKLIAKERKQSPHADRKELLQRAIDRWLKDNR